MIRITVADDHPVVLAGIKALIEADPQMSVVGEASDGTAALKLIMDTQPDIAVTDLSMPSLNGVELCERVAEHCPRVKVLVLTVHEDRAYVQKLLRAGACGYVLKRSAAGELVRAIHVVFAGGLYVDPAVAGTLLKHMAGDSAAVFSEELSPREEAVLKLAAQGFSNKEMAASLDVSIKSIETYKARATAKLGLHTRAEIVRYGASQGWLD
jgi:DNA-binding NarL/FixJ family response regulator